MENHIKAVGILWIVKGILGIFAGFIVLSILLGVGVFAGAASGEEIVLPILASIGLFLGILLTVLSLPEIIAGFGIMKHKQWGRILGLVVGALNLLDIPLGTALGVYTFWVLLKDESTKLFDSTEK
jgi:hypothetical protein